MAATLDRFADRKPGWDTPLMIESHQNGIRTKAMNPNTPVTYEEVVEDAIRCWDAGASAIHVHNEFRASRKGSRRRLHAGVEQDLEGAA